MSLMPEKMVKISILTHKKNIDPTVRAIARTGVFHLSSKPGEGSLSQTARRLLLNVGEQISRIEQFTQIAGVDPDKIGGSDSTLTFKTWVEATEKLLDMSRKLTAGFEDLLTSYRELEEEKSMLQQLYTDLELLRDLDTDLEPLTKGRIVRAVIATGPLDRMQRFIKEAKRKAEDKIIVIETRSEDRAVAILLILSKHLSEVEELAKQERLKIVTIPETMPKNPKKLIETLTERINNINKRLERLREEARKAVEPIADDLAKTYRGLEASRSALTILSKAREYGNYYVIEGFVPKSVKEDFKKYIIDEVGDNVVVEFKEIKRLHLDEDETPPSKYRISRMVEPFRMIPELYGPPKYNEIIPVYMAAILFPIIFGLMFPDLGHALVLLAAGLILWKKFGKNNINYRNLGMMVTYLAIAASVAGILAGEFFGPGTPVSCYLEDFYKNTLNLDYAPLALPIYSKLAACPYEAKEGKGDIVGEALMSYIFLSIRIGVVTLVLSVILGIINSIIERDAEKIIIHDTPKFLLFFSVALPALAYGEIEMVGATYMYMALGIGDPDTIQIASRTMLFIGLLWLLLGEFSYESIKHGLREGIRRLSNGFLEVFDSVLLLIGNTASYIRIMGIALAHIAVVVAFYEPVAGSLYNAPIQAALGSWIIYALGNLLDIGFESIVAFAHTLRLHLYEMFSKFYRGEGILYTPIKTPYIDTITIK